MSRYVMRAGHVHMSVQVAAWSANKIGESVNWAKRPPSPWFRKQTLQSHIMELGSAIIEAHCEGDDLRWHDGPARPSRAGVDRHPIAVVGRLSRPGDRVYSASPPSTPRLPDGPGSAFLRLTPLPNGTVWLVDARPQLA
jgi:hypothetical protein